MNPRCLGHGSECTSLRDLAAVAIRQRRSPAFLGERTSVDFTAAAAELTRRTSFMGCVPGQDATFVVLVNLSATPAGARPADEIAVAILKSL